MSGNERWSTKVGVKLLSDLVMFLIFSSNSLLDFHESIQVGPLKSLMYFVAGINTKWFWNIAKEKYFAPLKIPSFYLSDLLLILLLILLLTFF